MTININNITNVRNVNVNDSGTNLNNSGNIIQQIKKRRNRFALAEEFDLIEMGNEIAPPVGKVAMVFTDIKSPTYLLDNYPIEMRGAIKAHNEIMRRQLRICGGYEVKTEGGAFIVSFPTITSALIW